jgi:hypothetical protein
MMAPEQVDGVLTPPPAKPGDVVVVHVPDIGRWCVKEILQDYKGKYYYRVTRNDGKEATTIDAAGAEIIVRSA